MDRLGTFMHELGHALFDLADEYAGGAPSENKPFQNVWLDRATAVKDTNKRGQERPRRMAVRR